MRKTGSDKLSNFAQGHAANKYCVILLKYPCMFFYNCITGFQTRYFRVGENGCSKQEGSSPASLSQLEAATFYVLHAGLKCNDLFIFDGLGHPVTTVILVYLHYFSPHRTTNFTQNYLWPHKTKISFWIKDFDNL